MAPVDESEKDGLLVGFLIAGAADRCFGHHSRRNVQILAAYEGVRATTITLVLVFTLVVG